MHMHNPMLIGIAGQARSGKDTVGSRLVDDYGLQRLAFADPLKDMVAAMLGVARADLDRFPKEMPLPLVGMSPRALFQTLGTEWGRDLVHRDLWVRLAQRQWQLAQRDDGFAGMVITDVRMENEAAWIRDEGGVVIHVERAQRETVREHISEVPLAIDFKRDYRLRNDGTLDELYRRVDDLMRLLAYGRRATESSRVSL